MVASCLSRYRQGLPSPVPPLDRFCRLVKTGRNPSKAQPQSGKMLLSFINSRIRQLGAFDEERQDCRSFFMFAYFADRADKFNLTSFSGSGFDPLLRS
jgi:hypothetical protein